MQDLAGNIYVTTQIFGNLNCSDIGQGCGAVFKLDHDGKESAFTFSNTKDGEYPDGALLLSGSGPERLYGVTGSGGLDRCFLGSGCGVIYKFNPGGRIHTVYRFRGGEDGDGPLGGLVQDALGNFYGVTQSGGDATCDCGVVYKLSPAGIKTTLFAFLGVHGQLPPADGMFPAAGLARSASGDLYGVTTYGGTTCPQQDLAGCGVVFKVDKNGKETVLHTFTGGKDGAVPASRLMIDESGNLYGTATMGGQSDNGVVFRIKP